MAIETWTEAVPLTRPYVVAFRTTEAVELGFVRLRLDEGVLGFGCAAPVEEITGESFAACRAALESARSHDFDAAEWDAVRAQAFAKAPAAGAALDMAVCDALARCAAQPLVQYLGRAHDALPTSVTLGIRDLADSLAEADEYLARGFRVLKVKIGEDLDADVERLRRLRERVGPHVALRADANVGYRSADVERFFAGTEAVNLQFLEQPCRRELDGELSALPAAIRRRLAADESLHDERDAQRLTCTPRPFGIWNIKLAKCGGVRPALRIAALARAHGIDLMWGCMDESVVSIAAALHAAYACPATRYLDLDGSLDLARDPFVGGFALHDGVLRTLPAPGLAAEPA